MNLNDAFLQQSIARIDLLLQRQIARMQAASRHLSEAEPGWPGVYLSANQAQTLLQRPFAHAMPPLPDESRFDGALQQAGMQIKAVTGRAAAEGKVLRFHRLAETFGLTDFDRQALLLALAAALDGRYGKLIGFLHDDLTRKRPSIDLCLDLFAAPDAERLRCLDRFAPHAPLRRHRLLHPADEPGQPLPSPICDSFTIDATVLHWLLQGQYYQQISQIAQIENTKKSAQSAKSLILSESMQSELTQAAETAVLLQLHGPDDLRRETAARFVAVERERPLLTLDLAAVQGEMAAEAAVAHLLRDARLTGSVPHVAGFDACLTDDAPETAVLQPLCAYPDLILVSGRTPWQPRRHPRTKRLHTIACPLPTYSERLELLAHFIDHPQMMQIAQVKNNKSASSAKSADSLSPIAGQFKLSSGQWRDVVQTAVDHAVQADEPLSAEHLLAAARAHSNPRLAALARKITPRYTWHDLVLPDDQKGMLRELVDMVQQRPLVLEQWGVGRKLASSAGVTALFAGPPGTGKTMAAELIAAELGLDLYKIDLSGLVSKYIGETEKNLERIFGEAESSNAILFFDEADALFGKRSEVKDAHDRYANIEISYLLQRMEAYDGVTILATNLRANLDEAFTRRLHFAISFPFPGTADRLRIWQTLFPPDVPRDDDLDWQLLAQRFELAGGNIRNVMVTATYLAAANGNTVTMQHLLHGARRELQKMGRLVNENNFRLTIDD